MITVAVSPTLIEVPIGRLRELAELGDEFFAEATFPSRFIPEIFVQTWTGFLNARIGDLIALEKAGQIIGALGYLLFPDPNDGELNAMEMFWYVRASERGHGLRLLKAYETRARERGAKRLTMIHLTELMPDVLTRLYRARGYRPIETHYVREA